MTRHRTRALFWGLALVALFGSACRDKKPENLAPQASALPAAAPPERAAARLVVDTKTSKLTFVMQAPIEKISGEAEAALSGELFVVQDDLTKSTGLIKADLGKLVLYQQKRDDEKQQFSERKKNELQNQHARTWLEISDDVPEDVREQNRLAEFRITRIEDPSVASLAALSGSARKVTATVVGEFRLHARKNEKRARVELVFDYAGDQPKSVHVRTLEPLRIGLEEYDVRPREAFGKLAQRTLEALGSKVTKEAPVELEFGAAIE